MDRYKEALERATSIYESSNHAFSHKEMKEALETIFPEIKGDEDEMIRKEILDYIKTGTYHKKWVDWLEKQGEQKKSYDTCDSSMKDNKKSPYGEKRDFGYFEEKFKFKVGQWIVATGKCVYLIAKIDAFNVTLVDTNGDEYVFDASSLDDAHEWTIKDAKDGDVLVVNNEVFIYAHRKQMYSIAVAHCFVDSAGGFYLDGEFGYEEYGKTISPAAKEQRDLLFRKIRENDYEWNSEKLELIKIKRNVTSKFKIGDWLVHDMSDGRVTPVVQIIEMTDKSYVLDNGECFYFSDAEEIYRKWTIQDAKDGDVLVCIGKYGQEIGIIKEYVGKYGGCDKCFETYCFVDWDGIFRTGEYMGSKEIHPATKEQRDALMKSMADAGYTFDFEKKELKKIDNEIDNDKVVIKKGEKPVAWSEEDEATLKEIITDVKFEGYNNDMQANSYKKINWLKSLKYRIVPQPKQVLDFLDKLRTSKYKVQPQSKQEWSEEEMARIDKIIDVLDWAEEKGRITYSDWEDYVTYVKSLRPHINVTDKELAQAKKDAYNDALDKIEYHSEEPTFDDGWSAAIWYLKKRNAQPQNTWKPSDKQIEALEFMIRSYGESGTLSPYGGTLSHARELLYHLKEL